MSFTSTVPDAVPSDFQSSTPLVPLLALKNSLPLMLVKEVGFDWVAPGLMSLTSLVPPAVPLDFHSSRPLVPLSALKNSLPLTLVRDPKDELAAPRTIS